jgi:DNA-binding NarL/FixJ family response regulator
VGLKGASQPLRVLIAYQRGLVREGIRAMLERFALKVEEANDGQAAVTLAAEGQFHVVLLQESLPGLRASEALRQIVSQAPSTAVIVLLDFHDETVVFDFLNHGARGVLSVTSSLEELLLGIRTVACGGVHVTVRDCVTSIGQVSDRRTRSKPRLTPRQRQVVRLIAAGKTSREIGALLGISIKTAEFHRMVAMKKLGAHHTAAIVRYAISSGLAAT